MKLAQSPAPAELAQDEQAVLIDALHCLRVAVTVFDARERLIFASQHLNYLFRSLPPREALLGLSYEQLIRLEVAGRGNRGRRYTQRRGFCRAPPRTTARRRI
ncbi:MAG: hypothetical protein WDM89_13365 [Rhizomicrobium sp.]